MTTSMEVSAAADLDEDEADAAGSEYRSVSGLAVLAFVLGLASPAALAAPLLLAIPAAAVGAALLAERRIRISGGVLTGVGLARCGLALALASIAAAAVRGPVRDALLRRQMKPAVEEWFTLLAEGRDEQAMSLLSGQAAGMLRPSAEPGQQPVPEEEAKTISLQRLASDPVARCLRAKKPPLTVRWESPAAAPVFDGRRATIGADFSVSDGEAGEACRIHVQCVRFLAGAAEQPWRIERWSLASSE
jgi:hypothetical protein